MISRGQPVEQWDCGPLLLPTSGLTFRWLGVDEPQSAVTFERKFGESPPNDERLEVRLFTFKGETQQTAEAGDACR